MAPAYGRGAAHTHESDTPPHPLSVCDAGIWWVDWPAICKKYGCDYVLLAPRGSKCDQWGTCHGTEPIVLPFHDEPLNAAKWLRDLELRRPSRGEERQRAPLFANDNGRPFKDATFAAIIHDVLAAVLGPVRAKLYSPHSWRVWLASALRMADASDARIQAMGRWLNPESIKIYARMSKEEYASWVDKVMGVRRIDTARTTNLPIMDAAGAFEAWGDQLRVGKDDDLWDTTPAVEEPKPSALQPGARVAVYWTEMDEWFVGTYTRDVVEAADGGGKQRSSCVVYDAVGPWAKCSKRELTYWHCLDDEQWRHAGTDERP